MTDQDHLEEVLREAPEKSARDEEKDRRLKEIIENSRQIGLNGGVHRPARPPQ